jgi:hypothetical protein
MSDDGDEEAPLSRPYHYRPTKYDAFTKEDVKANVESWGVAVLKKAVPIEKVTATRKALLRNMGKLNPKFDPEDSSTWESALKDGEPLHGGLFQYGGLTHTSELHELRADQNILDTMAHLYETAATELVASWDGVFVGGEKHNPKKSNFSLHCDQRYGDPTPGKGPMEGMKVYQSWVNLNDYRGKIGDASLRVLARGHDFHGSYYSTFGYLFDDKTKSRDWHVICRGDKPNDQYQFYIDQGCDDVVLVTDPGDLVVWESCTPHSGVGYDEELGGHPFRCVAYISYLPRSVCPKASFKKRHEAIFNKDSQYYGRTWSHYADMRHVFPRWPSQTHPPFLSKEQLEEKWSAFTPITPDPSVFEDVNVRRVAGLC